MAALRTAGLVMLLAGATLASGCASFLRPDGPRTQAPGKSQLLIAPSAYFGERQDSNIINVDLLYRVGIAARADLGFRANLLGVASDVKIQLARAPGPDRGADVALAPAVGYGSDATWTRGSRVEWDWQVGLPLLVGINFTKYQLLLTPQLLYQRASVLPEGILHLGGTVAFGRTGGRGFSFYPALAVWKTLDPTRVIGSLSGPGPLVFQPSLVFRVAQ